MAGYIGSKAVILSTTAADVTGNAVINGDLTVKGTTVTVDSAAAQEIRLGDNDKMTFGDATGGDLQIYHDGTNSYINESGTGNLFIDAANYLTLRNTNGESYLAAQANGYVQLFYNGSQKLATTSTGVDITGTLTSDGLTVDGDVVIGNGSTLRIDDQDSIVFGTYSGGSSGTLLQGGTSTDYYVRVAGRLRQSISTGGDISFYDTSGNARFFWDASAESLGLGATSFAGETLRMERSGDMIVGLFSGASSSTFLNMGTTSNRDIGQIGYTQSTNHMFFRTNDAERMRIDSSGNVGIGTDSPAQSLDTTGKIRVRDGGNTTIPSIQMGPSGVDGLSLPTTNNIAFITNSSEAMRIDSSGNVGIGTGSPQSNGGATARVVHTHNSAAGNWAIDHWTTGSTGAAGGDGFIAGVIGSDAYLWNYEASSMIFATDTTEAMRIDSSGNLLVGKTSATTFNTEGIELRANDIVWATRTSGPSLELNRLTTDGDIVGLYKDGSAVGSIGTKSSNIYIGGGDVTLSFSDAADVIVPTGTDGATRDNAIDLGNSANRWKDGYFSGTVNAANFNTTSDATLKTNVATLTGSLDAVKSLRGVSFDWIDSGNSEVGVIAQEVEAVIPDVVSTNDQGIKSVKYGNLVGVLIEAIKEQQEQIDALKEQLNS